ncbi:MAG: T9SS type A sorting domain-containing protein [Fidelibacterota bacterium]|nr:MAG: T9SS type A sorting domain-containing protein [Candidatus Neomarinimicrobiota bacterium]
MKKIGLLFTVSLLAFTIMPAMNADGWREATAINQELAALAADASSIDAAGSHQIRQRPFSRERTTRDSFLGLRRVEPQNVVSPFQILSPAATIPVEITDASGAPVSEYEVGDTIAIIITYSDSVWVRPYVDNGDGSFDSETDFYFAPSDPEEEEEEIVVVDGDEDDEDPATGVWKITFDTGRVDEGDIIFSLQGVKVFFSLSNSDGSDTGLDTLDVLPPVSETSLSGNVSKYDETPAPNVLIIAFPEQMMEGEEDTPENLFLTLTDAAGDYTLFIDDDIAGTEFALFAMDFLGQYSGLYPDPQMVMLTVASGDSLIDNNFVLEEPTALISGTLTDELASPIAGVRIFAGMDGPFQAEDTTDVDGEYAIPAIAGEWHVRPGEYDLINLGYMVPHGRDDFDISEGDTVEVDFVAYKADTTISGKVYLDDIPQSDFEVGAWGDPVGMTFTKSGTDGSYTLDVSKKVDSRGYDVWPEDMPEQAYFADKLWGIQPGETDVDINLVTVTGGITGVVTDAATGDTLYGDVGIMVRDLTGAEFQTWIEWETGEYLIYLPDGIYEIMAFSHEYLPYYYASITVSGAVVTHNIELTTLVFDAKISGTLTDDEASPIAGVRVFAGAEGMFGMDDTTDAEGKYGFQVFAGWWHVGLSEEDLIDQGYMIPHGKEGFEVTTGDSITVDFVTYTTDATITGTVTWDDDASGVEYAEIQGDTPAGYYSRTQTGTDGTYSLPVSSKLDSIEITDEHGTWKTHGYCVNTWYMDAFSRSARPGGGSCEVYSGASGIDFIMYPADAFLSGYISDQYGNPVPDAGIHVFSIEDTMGFHDWRNTEFEGFYEMPLIGGYKWVLEIYLPYVHDGPALTDTFEVASGINLVKDYSLTVQYPPEFFTLSLPADSTVLIITDDNRSDSLTISWQAAVVEGTVHYDLLFIGDLAILPAFSQLTDTLVKLPYQEIVDSLVAHGKTSAITGQWEVHASGDDGKTWASINGPYTLTIDASTVGIRDQDLLPGQFALHQNYPNPFNPTTTLRFDLPEASEVYLVIYDLLGRQLVQLVDGRRDAGYHRIVWDGRDDRGRELPTGLYIARMVTPEFTRSVKLVLLK